MTQTPTITPEKARALRADLTHEKARAQLLTEPAKLRQRGLPEKCAERYREILMRRGNYGSLTDKDIEFLSAIQDTSLKADALKDLCNESGNDALGAIFGWAIIGGTIATVAVVNLFPQKRRKAA
jgi:hypothetical protein